jgi:ApbE superfamily uncharacterized protein (UPF0280 family)
LFFRYNNFIGEVGSRRELNQEAGKLPKLKDKLRRIKSNKYEKRFYRQWVNTDTLVKTHIIVGETDLLILSLSPPDLNLARQMIHSLRQDIKDYMAKDKRFGVSLKPLSVELNAPAIIQLMAQAASAANVGPMAAVAGSIAQLLGEYLLTQGCAEVIIENGGDIFISKQRHNRLVAIFAGDSKFSGKLKLLIKPGSTPCGICTSSANLGHSLSFGNAQAAVILARQAALADATATAVCNLVKSESDFNKALKFAGNITGVLGALIILNDNLASWGKIEIIN